MKFAFSSWNVNNRRLKSQHVDFLRQVQPELAAFQEVSKDFHDELAATDVFDWSAFSLALRPPGDSEGLARRLGCAVFGRSPFRFFSSSLLNELAFPERALVVRAGGDSAPTLEGKRALRLLYSINALQPTPQSGAAERQR